LPLAWCTRARRPALSHLRTPRMKRDRRTLDRGMPPLAPGLHPRVEPEPSAADPARVRDPPQSAPSLLPARRRHSTAAESVDLEQYRVRRQTRAGGTISEYRLVA
jgi:hypothetical protein